VDAISGLSASIGIS